MENLLKTPITDWHIQSQAKMADFAGYNMPIQYSGIINEHLHTRSQASVFDICHMGEFILRGDQATEALSKAVSHNLETLAIGKCRYGFLLNSAAGILDDLIVYKMAENTYFLVVNGACKDNDYKVLSQRLAACTLEDISENCGKIDLQGPKSLEVLEKLLQVDLKHLAYFSCQKMQYKGYDILVSRTGYTGELGYELYLDSKNALGLWQDLLANPTVQPAGLGARDTLRLEAGLPLYGHDLDHKHNPVEAGFEAMLSSKADYVGKDNLDKGQEKLVPLLIEGKRATRQGDKVLYNGQEVGVVTSGSFAPSVERVIALAYIKSDIASQEDFVIQTSKTQLNAKKTSTPFYTKGTARIKLS